LPLTDLPYSQLLEYRAEIAPHADFDAFWEKTLAQARAHDAEPELTLVRDTFLSTVDVFAGWNGEPVAAWLVLPAGAVEPLPVIVKFLGYSGGRGQPTEHLLPIS
jgi:cephalosporin-C deacetylase